MCSDQSRVTPVLYLLAMCLDTDLPCPLPGTGSARRTSFCMDRASARCPRLTWPPATSARPSCCTPHSPPACASPSPTPRRHTGLMPSPSECPGQRAGAFGGAVPDPCSGHSQGTRDFWAIFHDRFKHPLWHFLALYFVPSGSCSPPWDHHGVIAS